MDKLQSKNDKIKEKDGGKTIVSRNGENGY